MVKALFDNNNLIDCLNALPEAREELNRYAERVISSITWMEVMADAEGRLQAPTLGFLDGFENIGLDVRVAEKAVFLHRGSRIKLQDAV